jgi:hypothetical protein
MGAGAGASASQVIKDASADDLKKALEGISADDRAKIEKAIAATAPTLASVQKGTYIGIVNFGLADGYSRAKFDEDMPGLAPAFKPETEKGPLPGLLSKRWLANDETKTYGGVYLWKDEESFQKFKTVPEMPWLGAISVNPNFTGATLRGFKIVEELTIWADSVEQVGYVGLINFKLAEGYTEEKFMADMPGLKDVFKPGALPGLLSKRWINSGNGVYGGCYFWKDEDSFQKFKTMPEMPWLGAISVNPNFAGATLEGFPVHGGLTTICKGQ